MHKHAGNQGKVRRNRCHLQPWNPETLTGIFIQNFPVFGNNIQAGENSAGTEAKAYVKARLLPPPYSKKKTPILMTINM